MKQEAKARLGGLGRYLLAFGKWVLAAAALGVGCGTVGAVFHRAIDWATGFRMAHEAMIWLLPAAGAVTLLLYKLCRVELGEIGRAHV